MEYATVWDADTLSYIPLSINWSQASGVWMIVRPSRRYA